MSQLADTSPVLTESPARADEDATTLYDCYGARIREYCYGQLRDPQEAEDAVQSTFLYAFTLLRRGETPRKPLPWLYTIAHNVCRTRRRALKRRSSVESGIGLDAVQEIVGRNDPQHEDLTHLASSLAELPLSQRTALVLREWQGLSYEEIAMELGLTESAVEAVLFRARRNLAKKLQYVNDRAATITGAVLLWPSLRRLSPFGPGAKTAAATAFLVGTTALLPVGDAARPSWTARAVPPPATEPALVKSAPAALERPRAAKTLPPRITAEAHVAPPAATVTTDVEGSAAASAARAGTAPAPAVTSAGPATATAAPVVATAGQTVSDNTGDVLDAAQTTVTAAVNTVSSTADTVAGAANAVTSQVASAVPELPTVPSPSQSPPKNTPLPGLP